MALKDANQRQTLSPRFVRIAHATLTAGFDTFALSLALQSKSRANSFACLGTLQEPQQTSRKLFR